MQPYAHVYVLYNLHNTNEINVINEIILCFGFFFLSNQVRESQIKLDTFSGITVLFKDL